MRLKSADFENGDNIPSEFTCDGNDVSPQLSWEGVPKETKSFALRCDDPDGMSGNFIHWLVYGITKNVRNTNRGSPPEGARLVENDFGKKEYGGPCPHFGTHRYVFALFALNTEHLTGINRSNFADKVAEHTIAKAELMGRYKRKENP